MRAAGVKSCRSITKQNHEILQSDPGTRVFEIEAEDILGIPEAPGADFKLCARKVKLVKEIKFDGNYNTGNYNTGNWNTGNWNTGNWNTGNYNTGNWNTGNWNTGNYNTGNWNITNNSCGFFGLEEPNATCFGVDTGMNKKEFLGRFNISLGNLYSEIQSGEVNFAKYAHIPGATEENITKYCEKLKMLQ